MPFAEGAASPTLKYQGWSRDQNPHLRGAKNIWSPLGAGTQDKDVQGDRAEQHLGRAGGFWVPEHCLPAPSR